MNLMTNTYTLFYLHQNESNRINPIANTYTLFHLHQNESITYYIES